MNTEKYQGIFVRGYLTQTPDSTPGGIWDVSPDVIIVGPALMDWGQFTTDDGYGKTYNIPLNSYPPLSQQQVNFVWVRAINTQEGSFTGRIWLYLAESNMLLYPSAWISEGIRVGNSLINYQPIKTTGGSGSTNYMLTPKPFLVTPPDFNTPGDNWAVIALVENTPSDPPDSPHSKLSFDDDLNKFAQWVSQTPTTGFINTLPPPREPLVYQKVEARNFQTEGSYKIGFACAGFPTSGYSVSVMMAGPDFDNSVKLSNVSITDPNQQKTVPVKLPAGFSSSIVLSVNGPGSTLPNGASVRVLIM
ncbi:MAG: hypothetical protein U1F76_14375 [Candidatus Competibacteraceae bacterium]